MPRMGTLGCVHPKEFSGEYSSQIATLEFERLIAVFDSTLAGMDTEEPIQ